MLSGSDGDQGEQFFQKASGCVFHVLRDHGQQILKVFVWLQVVGLYCFCNTVDHSEGLCPVYSINDLPVLLLCA